MVKFNLSFERWNAEEASAGETFRRGIEESDISLRDCLRIINNNQPAASNSYGRYPNVWRETGRAEWFCFEWLEWETGDIVKFSIHFPRNSTPASRRRLCRILEKAY